MELLALELWIDLAQIIAFECRAGRYFAAEQAAAERAI
jgi:hypothetical protein